MRSLIVRPHWLIGWLLVVVFASGCFQTAGNSLPATSIAQSLPTFTLPPSETPIPTVTETPEPLPTNTPMEELPLNITEVAANTGGALQQEPIEAQVTPADEIPLQQADVVGQQETDPLALTATAIVQRATQVVEISLTETAQALFGTPLPTLTLTPEPGVIVATAAPLPLGSDCIHEVRAEDRNLYRISLTYGVLVMDIARASGIVNPDLITVGQRLTIPGCGTTGVRPPATSVPSTTAGSVGVGASPATGATTGGGTSYVVQQGETLFEISLRFGVPVNSIAAANGISNINLIYLNQTLIIP